MMSIRRCLTVLAIVCASSVPASAQNSSLSMATGNGFYSNCASEKSMFVIGVCYGYLSASIDSAIYARGSARTFCIPSQVENKQTFDTFMKYLNTNPDKRHFPTTVLVPLALSEAFPCS